jgi:hypothetical protein
VESAPPQSVLRSEGFAYGTNALLFGKGGRIAWFDLNENDELDNTDPTATTVDELHNLPDWIKYQGGLE